MGKKENISGFFPEKCKVSAKSGAYIVSEGTGWGPVPKWGTSLVTGELEVLEHASLR